MIDKAEIIVRRNNLCKNDDVIKDSKLIFICRKKGDLKITVGGRIWRLMKIILRR